MVKLQTVVKFAEIHINLFKKIKLFDKKYLALPLPQASPYARLNTSLHRKEHRSSLLLLTTGNLCSRCTQHHILRGRVNDPGNRTCKVKTLVNGTEIEPITKIAYLPH